MSLSDKICCDCEKCKAGGMLIPVKDLKQAIKELKEEDKDWIEDIIALIEINNYGKKDLLVKMKRLCKAHMDEKKKIFGDKLCVNDNGGEE